MSVTATSLTGGTATIINESTGQTVSHTFSGQPSLCEYNAEWIVEDFEDNGEPVPFANFGTVTFESAQAMTPTGFKGPMTANVIVIEQDGQTLTNAIVDDSSVTVSYEVS